MMQFPITHLFDEQKCYDYLLGLLHPQGLGCRCGKVLEKNQAPHKKQRRPCVVNYRCRICKQVFNLFTDSVWSGSSYKCSTIVRILQGFSEGIPTLHLSKELGLHYETLLERRHQFYGNAFDNRQQSPLADKEVEADDMFQNAGEKGTLHPDPDDPPRPRANKRVGLGTMDNDRPPILGTVGRESKQIRLDVCENTQQKTIQPQVEKKHKTVNHSLHEYARDEDGFHEVHVNTMEGFWSLLRSWLRPHRGISQEKLPRYLAFFEFVHNMRKRGKSLLGSLISVLVT